MEEYSNIESNKKVPQLNPKTGVSMDYSNQFNPLVSGFSIRGISFVKEMLKEIPFHMKKYEEVYSGYKNIVNNKNKDSIKRLDELSVHMNDIFKDLDSVNEEDFRKTCNELNFLIYGDANRDI